MKISLDASTLTIIFSLVILAYFIYQVVKYRHKLFSLKKYRIWLVLRFLVIILLVLALSNFKMFLTTRDTTTIFLVDRSLSVAEYKKNIEDYINKQLENKKTKEKVAVISFGREPMVEYPLSADVENIQLQTKPNPNFTNIERALSYSLNYFPNSTQKRLVLFTDGQENYGQVADMLPQLEKEKVNLLLYPLGKTHKKDVQLEAIQIPDNLYADQELPLKVQVNSNFSTQAVLRLFADDSLVLEKEINISPGLNKFPVSLNLAQDKQLSLRGEILCAQDENLLNNSLQKTIYMHDKPQILVIGAPQDTQNIVNLLDSLALDYQAFLPQEVPKSLDYLSGFQEFILANVNYDNFSADFISNMKRCIEQQGSGLLVIGGPNTFALGNYENTELEEILPVKCRMRDNKKHPNTGLILAIDCSGSMEEVSGGLKKMEIAKDAAKKSIEILGAEDYVGVLAFADRLEWIVPFQKVQDKKQILKDVDSLSSQGGTLILPALKEAGTTLEDSPVKVKHILLLTDGQGEKDGFRTLLEDFHEDKITLSTVGIGQDTDRVLLKKLSDLTQGRNYLVEDAYNITKIFAQETYLSTKKYLNNREFVPAFVNSEDFLPVQSLPSLQGYIGTGIKDKATLVLKSDWEDPILAYWQYGLGKALVWTGDLNGQWSKNYLNWSGFQNMWNRIINFSLPPSSSDLQVNIEQKQTKVKVNLDTTGISAESVQLAVQGPSKNQFKQNLAQIKPGIFTGELELAEVGDYALSFLVKQEDEIIAQVTRIVHLSYSPEYSLAEENILASLHAPILQGEQDVFNSPLLRVKSIEKEIYFLLVFLALILFIADIGVRKI